MHSFQVCFPSYFYMQESLSVCLCLRALLNGVPCPLTSVIIKILSLYALISNQAYYPLLWGSSCLNSYKSLRVQFYVTS